VTRLTTFVIGLTLLCGVLAQTPEHPSRVREYETLTLDSRVSHIAVVGDSYTTGTDEGGRGLYLVEQLATRWGSRPTPEGKAVWFELPLDAKDG